MRRLILAFVMLCLCSVPLFAKVVVFSQEGFPTLASQPMPGAALTQALSGMDVAFADVQSLKDAKTLEGAELLILPYGSAFPADAWAAIHAYMSRGGNVLVLGGQPFRVPVISNGGRFEQQREQDTYARQFDFRNTYEVPVAAGARFAWKTGYDFLGEERVRARRFFTVEGRVDGLGFVKNADGVALAAPVIVANHSGGRIVALDFDPEPGYWESPEGIALVQAAAKYARRGAASFWTELQYSTIKPFEPAHVVVHLYDPDRQQSSAKVNLQLLSSANQVVDTVEVAYAGGKLDSDVYFQKKLQPGLYTIKAVYENSGEPREVAYNGVWVEDEALLTSGPVFGVKGDFLTRDGKPFFPVGTNYFTTEDSGWDFSSSRNAWAWERDFADMEKHGVNFVRTGVWVSSKRFIEPVSEAANERFLRNLEAFLLSARRHNIIVNFTFFAFAPQAGTPPFSAPEGTQPNPYIDGGARWSQQNYILSVVNRFKNVPYLSWDLINEPSFSNPRRPWKGNTPNGDPAEVAAWHAWLQKKYGDITKLASAWAVTPEQLGSFDAVPLPSWDDLAFGRYGNPLQVRAVDYNLFAQEMFADWVRAMVGTIRGTGSKQLVNVGHDEGGVTDRVLNHFYAGAGVGFTTNHTYWQDHALLWDSIAAKVPGIPNITGETGYQPVWAPDGAWRYNEFTGYGLTERKWALGFAAGSSGAVQWDWDREADFGMKRSDNSAKTWQFAMRDMGQFAEKAAPFATQLVQPEIAIVLPQSLQLSVYGRFSLEAQQRAVKALYQYARGEAYAVGEYQIERLGNPKLIILPSPWLMSPESMEAVLDNVRNGATLLVSGPFDMDPHFHATGIQKEIGLDYTITPLTSADVTAPWAGGSARMTYGGDKTTFLSRAVLPNGQQWSEVKLGKGTVLFMALPLELNDELPAVGNVYRYAMTRAGVTPTYSTKISEPGILICPTRYPHATLYVLTSETTRQDVAFIDQRSRKQFSGTLDAGRAALLLVAEDGTLLASYNWGHRADGAMTGTTRLSD